MTRIEYVLQLTLKKIKEFGKLTLANMANCGSIIQCTYDLSDNKS